MNESISDNVAALATWYLGNSDNCYDYSYTNLVEWLEGTEWTDIGAVVECITNQIISFKN